MASESPVRWWRPFAALERRGVLGMNARNARYISVYNPRRLYPLVDDKVRTKTLAIEAGIAVPELYGIVGAAHQVRHVHALVRERESFVVKPARGAGGNGILVIVGRRGDRYLKANGQLLDPGDLEYHVSNVLSGMYSLGGRSDAAILEYRVRFDPLFEPITFQGVPDIRTVVFRGVPVMAMVRLPTRRSDGRANLHQGAVGAGVNLSTGRTLSGVMQDRLVGEHPDTYQPIAGHAIPGWDDLLERAARCFELTGLGYLGVDMVLDEDLGPLVLELNARPGISIQIANRAGLVPRLEAVEGLYRERGERWTPGERVHMARVLFGGAAGDEAAGEGAAGGT